MHAAIAKLEADMHRSADTHLIVYPLPSEWDIDLYLKDESTHPTGSLKHRLARSLVLYGLCDGRIHEGTTLVEASSGSTAVSEAYVARMLGLPFVAVMPASISPEKIAAVEHYGGTVRLVDDPTAIYDEATRIAESTGGHYLDQFTFAERATDWRGNNNIAESVFSQLALERHPIPRWIVVGAGTGGTSATFGRYLRYRRHDTELAVVDPERSVFGDYWASGDTTLHLQAASRIEGIGRPRVEPSFVAEVVDRLLAVPDAASIAAMRHLSRVLGRRVGGSTGTNLWGAFTLIDELRTQGGTGSVVTLICDPGDRYGHTYYDDAWIRTQGLDLAGYSAAIDRFLTGARLTA